MNKVFFCHQHLTKVGSKNSPIFKKVVSKDWYVKIDGNLFETFIKCLVFYLGMILKKIYLVFLYTIRKGKINMEYV